MSLYWVLLADTYGKFLTDILRHESVEDLSRLTLDDVSSSSAGSSNGQAGDANSTLICFVLVEEASSAHAFCSRYDFGPWPLQGMRELPAPALAMLRRARALFANGFLFDELPLELVTRAVTAAAASGAALFFDPGPRYAALTVS